MSNYTVQYHIGRVVAQPAHGEGGNQSTPWNAGSIPVGMANRLITGLIVIKV